MLWKLERKTGSFLGYTQTVFQNVFEKIDPETRHAALSRTTSSSRRSTSG